MAEYITREAAVAVCGAQYKECLRKSDMCGDTVAWNICFEIKQLPAADVAPVRHGRWVCNGIPDSMLSKCSVCGILYGAYSFNYCPNCGAKMDGE